MGDGLKRAFAAARATRKQALWDVIEVSFQPPNKVRLIERDKSERNAEAIVSMAVMRRGVERSFFTLAPAGRFQDGDEYSMRADA